MTDQKLQFNILPFHWPQGPVQLYFSDKAQPKAYRLEESHFPNELGSLFPGIYSPGQAYINTSFDQPLEGSAPLSIDLRTDNPRLVRLYFHYQIYSYFKSQRQCIVRNNFRKKLEVRVPADKLETEDYRVFECFSLRVQFAEVSAHPELLVAYKQQTRVYKRSVADLIQSVAPHLLSRVISGNRLVRYQRFVQEEDADYDNAFPVLTKALWKALGKTAPTPDTSNKYLKHYKYTRGFCGKFLNNSAFKAVLPIHEQFVTEEPKRIFCIDQQMPVFAAGQDTGRVLKPYKKSSYPNIQLFFVVARRHEYMIETVKQYFFKGVNGFPGLSKYAQLNIHPCKELDIIYDDTAQIMPQIRKALDDHACCWMDDVTYVAVCITPYSRYAGEEGGDCSCADGNCPVDTEQKAAYGQVVEALLERCILPQEVDTEMLVKAAAEQERQLERIAVAMLAKLGGVPWRLPMPVENELIAGIGIFKQKADGVQYMGCTSCYTNEGRFKESGFFQKHETERLAGYVSYVTRKYAEAHGYPNRLIIHFYNRLSSKELVPIRKAIAALEFPKPIPIFMITMSKTETDDIVAFDTGCEELMPPSGTIIKVGKDRYLLYHNSRWADGNGSSAGRRFGEWDRDCVMGDKEPGVGERYRFPIKLRVECSDQEQLSNETVYELLGQVYQLSCMYWGALSQQNLPVTVKYPELAVRMLPYFRDGRMPEFGKSSLWFL